MIMQTPFKNIISIIMFPMQDNYITLSAPTRPENSWWNIGFRTISPGRPRCLINEIRELFQRALLLHTLRDYSGLLCEGFMV